MEIIAKISKNDYLTGIRVFEKEETASKKLIIKSLMDVSSLLFRSVNGRMYTEKRSSHCWMLTSLCLKRIRIVSCKFWHCC